MEPYQKSDAISEISDPRKPPVAMSHSIPFYLDVSLSNRNKGGEIFLVKVIKVQLRTLGQSYVKFRFDIAIFKHSDEPIF